MIAHLRGRLLEKHPQRLIVEVAGVGYDVQVPLSTFYGCGEPGAEIALRVHTHVREDSLALYGFLTRLELTMFERLILVNGIGPKLALSVLSGIDARELVTAIERADVARLVVIPGVGKKTAERICIELRDRLPKGLEAASSEPAGAVPNAMRDDLISALVNLGYHRQTIETVVEPLLAAASEPRFEDILRAALKRLSHT